MFKHFEDMKEKLGINEELQEKLNDDKSKNFFVHHFRRRDI